MDKGALCRVLRSFYAEARSKSGQLYSKSSLISIRSSLNRYLNEPPYCRTLDLTKDPELRAANLTLAAVIRKLEEQGAGPVVQKQAITRADLRKLYTCSVFSTQSPFGLLNKVWFETCMYFCTRGRENQRELEEDSFGLAVDEDGRKFVYFKALGPYHKSRSSSWSKKRAESSDEENLPRMYETGTEFCPYASFVKYLSKRNPLCKAFFQRPRDHCSEGDITWYENKAIGKNLLGTRMQMLSKAAKLSKTYTNHCIGAVSIATLNSIAGIGTKLGGPPPPPHHHHPPPHHHHHHHLLHHPAGGGCYTPAALNGGPRPRPPAANPYVLPKDGDAAPVKAEAAAVAPAKRALYEAVFPAGAAAGGDACGPSASPKRLCRRPAEPLDAAAPAVVVVSVKHDPLPHLLPEANGHRSTTSPTVVSPALVSPTQVLISSGEIPARLITLRKRNHVLSSARSTDWAGYAQQCPGLKEEAVSNRHAGYGARDPCLEGWDRRSTPGDSTFWDKEDVAVKIVPSDPVAPVQPNHLLRELPPVRNEDEEKHHDGIRRLRRLKSICHAPCCTRSRLLNTLWALSEGPAQPGVICGCSMPWL
uniref:ZMYM2-like/QRICH1 C-terminal domain-containing protein n=1 Tax=Anas platyrhynchos TaxID=8839 RepID=A0A8B9TH60_ANAPL